MRTSPPQLGRTYISSFDPSLSIYVVDVHVFENSKDANTAFIVEGCDPAYKDDSRNAYGYDFSAEVWVKHNFIVAPDSDVS